MRILVYSIIFCIVLLSGCLSPECRFSGDCQGKLHPNCSSDWLCIDGKCVWGCSECVLSLCDCRCYPKGETPEEKTGRLCGINCLREYNVSGCEYGGGKCAEVYAEKENLSIPNPAAEYCIKQGYSSEVKIREDGSQYGVCIFPDGEECDEWSYFRGECVLYSVSPCSDMPMENISRWKGARFYGGSDYITIRQNLSYVCCANVTVSSKVEGNIVKVTEKNVGEMCRCICGYYINITIPGLRPGKYRVELYGVEFEDMAAELIEEASVEVGAFDSGCSSDEDCVPAQCCHPTSCVTAKEAPDCSGKMCTTVCMPNTMDCGQGKCVCRSSRCVVEWNTLK